MLVNLSIRNLVLIERLELDFGPGLTALTGETGAGKSIILDALGLALGARADRALVRAGADHAQVIASFAVAADHPARRLLDEQGIGVDDDEIVVRRQLAVDGRSRAWVADSPVSGGLLRQLGELLVEVHGQHAGRALLEPAFHRDVLDRFGGLEQLRSDLRTAWRTWKDAEARLRAAREAREEMERERKSLVHLVEELAALAIRPGEEDELAERRRRLMQREKLATLLEETRAVLAQAIERLAGAQRRAERTTELAGDELRPAAEALDRALIESTEADEQLAAAARRLEHDEDTLEAVEERLFALRDAGRKYRCPVDELPALLERSRARLEGLAEDDQRLAALANAAADAQVRFHELAEALGRGRQQAAARLARAVAAELPPLRLERARFRAGLERLDPAQWTAEGAERVRFEVATNPGQPFGPLDRIASGGELARFMLALEVVVARLDPVPTMIFDEVDAGIGGATAAAVGERLARLGRERQVLVVTHAPQVAARADRHILIEKRGDARATTVHATSLDHRARRDELARMLAGHEITDAARAAADSLLDTAAGSPG